MCIKFRSHYQDGLHAHARIMKKMTILSNSEVNVRCPLAVKDRLIVSPETALSIKAEILRPGEPEIVYMVQVT